MHDRESILVEDSVCWLHVERALVAMLATSEGPIEEPARVRRASSRRGLTRGFHRPEEPLTGRRPSLLPLPARTPMEPQRHLRSSWCLVAPLAIALGCASGGTSDAALSDAALSDAALSDAALPDAALPEDPCAGVECVEPPDLCHRTDGRCVDGQCEYEALDAVPCDDSDPLTSNDMCVRGVCTGENLGSDFVQVASGNSHNCARLRSGEVLCWGGNEHGQLGDGTTTDRLRPTFVVGLTDAVDLSAGESHTCAVRATGEVLCWGEGRFRRLGTGTTEDALVPQRTFGITNAVEVVAGYFHSCARLSSGEVRCWGSDTVGQVGDGSRSSLDGRPSSVVGITDAVQLTSGHYFVCARHVGGNVSCWGSNGGKLGDGTTTDRDAPVAVMGLEDAIDIGAGTNHMCAVRESGDALCWGPNLSGRLGDGTSDVDRLTPTPVVGIRTAIQIDGSNLSSCALTSSGDVWCWGNDLYGQLGRAGASGSVGLAADRVVDGTGFAQIDLAHNHVCGVRRDGTVWCWGANFHGQLGDGTTMVRNVPTQVMP